MLNKDDFDLIFQALDSLVEKTAGQALYNKLVSCLDADSYEEAVSLAQEPVDKSAIERVDESVILLKAKLIRIKNANVPDELFRKVVVDEKPVV